MQKLYDLMLYTTLPHPERDRIHVLTRSAGRLPQALTPALGPCAYRGRRRRRREEKEGKGRGWIQGETGWKVLWYQQVSTGVGERREERLQNKQHGFITQ